MKPIYATFSPDSISATLDVDSISASLSAESISATLTERYNFEDMKYLDTISLTAGAETDITTTLTTKPYNVQLLDSSGNVIESTLQIRTELSGGVYHIYIYSVDALTDVGLYILY